MHRPDRPRDQDKPGRRWSVPHGGHKHALAQRRGEREVPRPDLAAGGHRRRAGWNAGLQAQRDGCASRRAGDGRRDGDPQLQRGWQGRGDKAGRHLAAAGGAQVHRGAGTPSAGCAGSSIRREPRGRNGGYEDGSIQDEGRGQQPEREG